MALRFSYPLSEIVLQFCGFDSPDILYPEQSNSSPLEYWLRNCPTQLGYFFSFARKLLYSWSWHDYSEQMINCDARQQSWKKRTREFLIWLGTMSLQAAGQRVYEFKKINKLPWRQFDSIQDLRTNGLIIQWYYEPPSLKMWKNCNSVIKTHPLMF